VPSTLTVTNNLDNGSAGSLRYEIGQAKKGDTIVFAPSLDGQTITLSGSELDITKSLTIQGPGAGLVTINGGADGIDNNVGSRVFAVENKTTVTLSGLTISGGVGKSGFPYFVAASAYDNKGGGILNLGTLTVSGCTISGNYINPASSAGCYGGGIYNAGTLTVTGSTVSGNSVNPGADFGSGYGGGIYNAGALTVSNSTISSNFARTDGGGIYNAGTATVGGCTLSNNRAGYLGGAIYNAGTLTVSNSSFIGNYDAYFGNNIYGPYTDGGGNSFS
jgi:predicted outer membrane repeat protein